MTEAELRERFPHASATFIRANASDTGGTDFLADSAREAAKLERNLGDGTLAKIQIQRRIGGRFLVCVKSFRKRLLDEDNLCCKYTVDLLRYSGVIPNDTPGSAKIEVSQEKVGPKEPERIEIKVFRL